MAWRIRRRAATTAAVATVVALMLVSCGSDDDESSSGSNSVEDLDSGSETTESDDSTSTTEAPSPDELAIAAYERGWEVEFEALNPPNPQHPAIGEVFTGEAAQYIIGVIVTAQNSGLYSTGSMETNPLPISVTAEKVHIRDCATEYSETYHMGTNELVEAGPYPPRTREAEVINQDGTWRVSVLRTTEEPCTPG